MAAGIKEVAKAVGVSEATVSRWESGDIAEVGSGKIAALARVLQMDPAHLLGQEAEAAQTAAQNAPRPQTQLEEYLEQLRTRPEMRTFFSLAKNATKAEVEEAVRIVEAYFQVRQADERQERRRTDEVDDADEADDDAGGGD